MLDARLVWDLEDDPDGNIRHIAEHGITVEDVQDVISDPRSSTEVSKSSGRAITFGDITSASECSHRLKAGASL